MLHNYKWIITFVGTVLLISALYYTSNTQKESPPQTKEIQGINIQHDKVKETSVDKNTQPPPITATKNALNWDYNGICNEKNADGSNCESLQEKFDPLAWKESLSPEQQDKINQIDADLDARQARVDSYKWMSSIELATQLQYTLNIHDIDAYNAMLPTVITQFQQVEKYDPAYAILRNMSLNLKDYTQQQILAHTLQEIGTVESTNILRDWLNRLDETPETHNLRIDLKSLL